MDDPARTEERVPAREALTFARPDNGDARGLACKEDEPLKTGDPTNRLNSIWFGRGEQLKLKAFHAAEQMLRA